VDDDECASITGACAEDLVVAMQDECILGSLAFALLLHRYCDLIVQVAAKEDASARLLTRIAAFPHNA
jgi:hypothetical protein